MIIKKIGLNVENLIESNINLIVTIGAFDGIHIGHKRLFTELLDEKTRRGRSYKTAVITFDKHPDFYLNKRADKLIIESNINKYKEFESFGIDYIFLLEKEVLSLSYKDFHEKILNKINTKIVVVGDEFRYGYKALGNVQTLQEDYETKTFLILKQDGIKVSSSDIRNLLQEGNIKEANVLLGHNYYIDCRVIKCDNNILTLQKVNNEKVLKNGIYDCKIKIVNVTIFLKAKVNDNFLILYYENLNYDFEKLINKEIKVEFI